MDEWGEEEARELRRRLVFKQNLPSVDHVHLTLDMLLLEGRRLVRKERLLAPPPCCLLPVTGDFAWHASGRRARARHEHEAFSGVPCKSEARGGGEHPRPANFGTWPCMVLMRQKTCPATAPSPVGPSPCTCRISASLCGSFALP